MVLLLSSVSAILMLFLKVLVLFTIFSILYLFNVDRRKTLLGRALKDFLVGLVIWAIGFAFLLPIGSSPPFLFLIWMGLLPFGYFFFLINLYWLIPSFDEKKKKFIFIIIYISAAAFLSYVFIFMGAVGGSMMKYGINYHIFFFIVSMIISTALAWFIYLRNKKKQQVFYLKKELGKSTSDLQFLKSQINPHFLFNSLNTFYGMAIKENAVKTSDGIQRLGDMMRFMLQDNQKDQIPMTKEISYLKDFIYIQQLRLAESENIQLMVNISEPSHEYFIAPMLLIPFVENAFKHGIRLQEKSWINIELYCEKEVLHFEVRNSVHTKINNDTEQESTGIGLENVKERLKLLYPNKHKLTISEEEGEYTIHLALTF